MTTFALLHGAYGSGALWGRLAAELEARGHRAVAPDLPIDDGGATFADHADVAEAAVGPDEDVHVVGHSMGGVTAAMLAARRPHARVTYVAALLPQPGHPLTDVLGEAIDPAIPAAEVRGEDGLRRLPQAVADERLAPGLTLRGQAVAAYFESCPLDAVPAGPYVVCTRDRVVSPDYGRKHAPGTVVELDAGHMPMLECPAVLADLLLA